MSGDEPIRDESGRVLVDIENLRTRRPTPPRPEFDLTTAMARDVLTADLRRSEERIVKLQAENQKLRATIEGMSRRRYDSTVARVAGNLLSGMPLPSDEVAGDDPERIKQVALDRARYATASVAMARAIVAETLRTEPEAS
jgi:hypothetical protein